MVKSFYLDNKKSRDFGILIDESGAFGSPQLDKNQIAIPGRNGDIIVSNKRYENFELSYKCGIIGRNIDKKIREIKAWLYSNKYRMLYDDFTGNEYFRYAYFCGPLKVESSKQLANFEVVFNCKPFLYSFEGQKWIDLNDAVELINPEMLSSKPLLKVTGKGEIQVNSQRTVISDENTIYIDTETQNAYYDNNGIHINANSKVTNCDLELIPGKNIIFYDNTEITLSILPRWCSL